MLSGLGQRLSMCGDAEAPLNLIAVDDVVPEMWRLARAGFPGGLVHHVTSDVQPSVERVLAEVGEQCGIGPIQTLARRERPPSPVEQVMDRRATFYSSYLRAGKRFARRSGPTLRVSDDDVSHYVREYLRARRGEGLTSLFTRSLVRAVDGQALVSYATGPEDRPALLLCNAYGVPVDVWLPLVRMLGREFRLITWEQRSSSDPELLDSGLDAHVADMRRVLNHHGVGRAHLVGFCTGADLALRFAELYPARVLGTVAVAGALNGSAAGETSFQRSMRKLVERAALDVRHAELYHRVLFGVGERQPTSRARRDDHAMLSDMLGALDPALLHLTSAPFRDPASLHRYALTMRAHFAHAARHGLAIPAGDVLLIVGDADEVVHPDASRAAVRALPRARLVELAGADHFALFSDARVGEAIRAFVNECDHAARSHVAADCARHCA